MATQNFLNLTGLTQYDGLIKQYIGTEDAKSIKSLTVSGNTVSFFKTEDASGTAAYTVNLPDVSGFMDKIASASGDKVVVSNSNGQVSESSIKIDEVITGYYLSDASSGDIMIYNGDGQISNCGLSYEDVATTSDVGEVASALETLDLSLAIVAKSGAAINVSYDNTDSGLTADDVQGAIDELAEASAGGVASKTVYMVASGSTTDYAQVYDVYQGANGSPSSPVPAEKIGTINIPKDKVVESGSVGTVTTPDEPYPGAQVGDKYIELVLQNVADPLYIPANSLVDIYTGGTTTEATVTIDNNNEITVAIGEINGSKLTAGSVAKGKLATGVQDSLDLADSAVQSVVEGSANGTIAVDGTDVAVHGLGSAAYTASTAYDAAGAAATAESNANAYTDAATAAIASSDIAALFN